ncbi:RES family NAD+ phosphorylase [Paenibacillus nitricinens]|uniref:RES family NAD+ phosphorylase n=1 Tax=Paenibacillus nitricinens TaxID=3367691 RepID=UPI003F852AE0
MNCCEKCFRSEVIKSIIKSIKRIGECDFCGNNNVHIYSLENDQGIDEMFNNILSIFKLGTELMTDGYSPYKLVSIKDEFEKKWSIFNDFDAEKIHMFLNLLLESRYPNKISLLNNQVGIIEWMNVDYLYQNSVLRGTPWEDVVEYIKHKNRFHTNHLNYSVLNEYLPKITSTIDEDTFYRGRISNDKELTVFQMGAPHPSVATAGRANSEGISHLYLANEIGTVISEIRPNLSDTVYIGKFRLDEKLKVIDFRLLKNLDVFEFDDPTMFAINLENFHKINRAISKPIRSGDGKLDYLPTQIIVDYIKSLNETKSAGYHGIVFESSVSMNGYNLMLFDPDSISCVRIEKRTINNLSYGFPICG